MSTDGSRSAAGSRRIPPTGILVVAALSVAAGTWAFWPALRAGFELDDWLHLARLRGDVEGLTGGILELFTFAEPRPEPLGPIQGDFLPWWSSAELKLRFLRPLSALTYHVDHALFGADPVAFHAVNLAGYGLLVAACVALYGALARVSGRGLSTVLAAGLLFALAREHEENVAWIAGRYSLASALLGCLALLAHHRWRSERRAGVPWATLALFALALLASELSLAFLAFFVAYELALARDGARERLLALAPLAALAGAWLVAYVALGYGAEGTASYDNPLTEPELFLGRLGRRTGASAMRLVLPAALEPGYRATAPAQAWTWPAGWSLLAAPLAAIVLGLALVLLAVRDRTVRFALLGSLLALLPLAVRAPVPRMLLISSIGSSWAIACLVGSGLARLRRPRRLALPWNAAHLLLAVLVLATVWQDPLAARRRTAMRAHRSAELRERSLALRVPDDPDARVVLVTSPQPFDVFFGPFVRRVLAPGGPGEPGGPGGIWGISTSEGRHVLTRTGERSFRLEIDLAEQPLGLVPRPLLLLWRDDDDLEPGDVLRRGVLAVEIEGIDAQGRIHAVEVSLDRSLDDPAVRLVTWERGGWRTREAPARGESIEIHTRSLWQAPVGGHRVEEPPAERAAPRGDGGAGDPRDAGNGDAREPGDPGDPVDSRSPEEREGGTSGGTPGSGHAGDDPRRAPGA